MKIVGDAVGRREKLAGERCAGFVDLGAKSGVKIAGVLAGFDLFGGVEAHFGDFHAGVALGAESFLGVIGRGGREGVQEAGDGSGEVRGGFDDGVAPSGGALGGTQFGEGTVEVCEDLC